MAESPAHRFGQYLGNLLEALFLPELEAFCQAHGLYVDKHGVRPVRKGKKATWVDDYGNSHDLDFVVEKGGAPEVQGRPLAFIEAAWRRYTKHSRNKAQEIQGAILPLSEKYVWDKPFLGAVLAGVFTAGSLTQLRSQGFNIIYIEYEGLKRCFAAEGIDIGFDEDTPTAWFGQTIAQIEAGGAGLTERLIARLRRDNRAAFDEFLAKLKKKLTRHIERLLVIPMFGAEHAFDTATDAMNFVKGYRPALEPGPFRKFEIRVKYSNGDQLDAIFEDAADVERFFAYIG